MQDGFIAARAPRDPALPHLARALDGALAAERLRAYWGPARVTARVLKHVPGKRCVIAYECTDGRRLVAKMYRKDRARRHAAILAALSPALPGRTRTPDLVDCWTDWGLVVETWVTGNPAPDWNGLAARPELLERFAVALADLHGCTVDAVPVHDLAAHLRRMCHPGAEALAAAHPALGQAAIALQRALQAHAGPAAEMATCHGDFGPAQIFVGPDTVSLVDLDGACRSDAALDVANLRVGLETHAGAAGRAAGDRFLAAYRTASGRALRTLPAYEALCDLRRATIAWRRGLEGWEQDCRSLLGRGGARL